jgi:hypothetical protein
VHHDLDAAIARELAISAALRADFLARGYSPMAGTEPEATDASLPFEVADDLESLAGNAASPHGLTPDEEVKLLVLTEEHGEDAVTHLAACLSHQVITQLCESCAERLSAVRRVHRFRRPAAARRLSDLQSLWLEVAGSALMAMAGAL